MNMMTPLQRSMMTPAELSAVDRQTLRGNKLRALRDYIAGLPAWKVNLNVVRQTVNGCEVGCIMGWAHRLFADQVRDRCYVALCHHLDVRPYSEGVDWLFAADESPCRYHHEVALQRLDRAIRLNNEGRLPGWPYDAEMPLQSPRRRRAVLRQRRAAREAEVFA
jgi:hypothetical protein